MDKDKVLNFNLLKSQLQEAANRNDLDTYTNALSKIAPSENKMMNLAVSLRDATGNKMLQNKIIQEMTTHALDEMAKNPHIDPSKFPLDGVPGGTSMDLTKLVGFPKQPVQLSNNDMLAKSLASPLDESGSPKLARMDNPIETAKFGMKPSEFEPTLRPFDKAADAGAGVENIYNEAMKHEGRAPTSGWKDFAETINKKGDMKHTTKYSDDVLNKARNVVGRGIKSGPAKKILSAIPLLGGVASAALSQDASAGIPILSEAENVGEGSDQVDGLEPAFPTYKDNTKFEELKKRFRQ